VGADGGICVGADGGIRVGADDKGGAVRPGWGGGAEGAFDLVHGENGGKRKG
jgi:hypothetical protein